MNKEKLKDELRLESINKLTQKMAKLVSDSFTNFFLAKNKLKPILIKKMNMNCQ